MTLDGATLRQDALLVPSRGPRLIRDCLPAAVRAAVEAEAGPVLEIDAISAGLNSGITAVPHTTHTPVFVKGLPTDHRRIATQHREASLAATLTRLGRVSAPDMLLARIERRWADHADERAIALLAASLAALLRAYSSNNCC